MKQATEIRTLKELLKGREAENELLLNKLKEKKVLEGASQKKTGKYSHNLIRELRRQLTGLEMERDELKK